MYRKSAIGSLRQMLASKNLQAIIIPTNDPHFGEYTQNYYKVREWLSGFNGSAGTLVVTMESAALWTDSRYFVQAQAQLEGSGIELMKMKMPGTPSIETWLESEFVSSRGGRVAIDQALFSYSEYTSLAENLAPRYEVVPVDDFFSEIWESREALIFNQIEYLSVEYSGEESISKYRRLKALLERYAAGKFAYIVTACDEVAWLCNIRGTDIEYNPLVQSYAVVTEDKVHLFVKREAVGAQVEEMLSSQNIVLHDYFDYVDFLSAIPADVLRICSPSKVTVRDYKALQVSGAKYISDPVTGGALNRMKAVKNGVELEGFRHAFLQDGVAWCRLLKFIDDSLAAGKSLTEYEIGEKLISFRRDLDGYKGESFEPIVAFGANGALPHYSATQEKSSSVCAGNKFLLMDTGAQFLFGTTDTTRTIPLGPLDDDKKRFYTLVLKGMISLSMAKFPSGTRGASLDILARGPLFGEGVMYYHGTGHGIGHYLCVHEGPQSVRMEENPVPLEPGMVISNEPAIYFAGRYGIRTENVVAVKAWKEGEFGQFNEFETFTLVPIATSCVDPKLLTAAELEWLNNYNARVFEQISPLLNSEEEANWLSNVTATIG